MPWVSRNEQHRNERTERWTPETFLLYVSNKHSTYTIQITRYNAMMKINCLATEKAHSQISINRPFDSLFLSFAFSHYKIPFGGMHRKRIISISNCAAKVEWERFVMKIASSWACLFIQNIHITNDVNVPSNRCWCVWVSVFMCSVLIRSPLLILNRFSGYPFQCPFNQLTTNGHRHMRMKSNSTRNRIITYEE